MLSGEKILITGAAGRVAFPIARELAKNNEVHGMARFADPADRDKLRQAGIGAILSSGSRSLRGQMRQANALGIPYTVILGDDENQRGEVVIRDMAASTQEAKPMQEFLESAGAYIT